MKSTTMQKLAFRESIKHPALLVWMLYLCAIPFYVGASGLPQPSNVLLVMMIPLALRGWDRRFGAGEAKTIRSILLFVLWVALINFGWAALHSKWGLQDYVLHPFYYAFNFVLFVIVLVLNRRFGLQFLRATTLALIVIVFVQVLASVAMIGVGSRGQLFFNNPNQLGYYALLAASALALMQKPTGMGRGVIAAALLGCAYLAMLSASRAAVLGVGMLFFLLVFSNPRIIIAGILLSVVVVSAGGPVTDAIDRLQERHELRGNEEFAKVRGYNRLWDYKEHLVIGAGEGEYERFSETGRSREIHSSAATIVFSYGVIGALLFAMFALRVASGATRMMLLMLVPTVGYTIAHQGLRFTMFWVLLAVFIAVRRALPPARQRIV